MRTAASSTSPRAASARITTAFGRGPVLPNGRIRPSWPPAETGWTERRGHPLLIRYYGRDDSQHSSGDGRLVALDDRGMRASTSRGRCFIWDRGQGAAGERCPVWGRLGGDLELGSHASEPFEVTGLSEAVSMNDDSLETRELGEDGRVLDSLAGEEID